MTANLKLPENVTRLKRGVYIVRTQAGFRRALKHFGPASQDLEVKGFPQSYPSVVFLRNAYCGHHYTVATCIHVNTMRAACSDPFTAQPAPQSPQPSHKPETA